MEHNAYFEAHYLSSKTASMIREALPCMKAHIHIHTESDGTMRTSSENTHITDFMYAITPVKCRLLCASKCNLVWFVIIELHWQSGRGVLRLLLHKWIAGH